MTDDGPVVEDLLLVLFDPRHGVFVGEGERLAHALAAAVVIDLAFRGDVELEPGGRVSGGSVAARTPSAPLPASLSAGWELVERRPVGMHALLLQAGHVVRQPVIDRLVERGDLRSEKHRALGLFPSTRLVAGELARRDRLVARIRAVLVDGETPDLRSGAVAMVLSAAGLLALLHHEIPWSGSVHERGTELEAGRWAVAADGDERAPADAVDASGLAETLRLISYS
ncbi:MAG: GOLPH3/VPS74 family protein [Actinomycetaceae bacterium]